MLAAKSPLRKPSIRDLWDRMFQRCKQEDCSRELTSGSRSREWRTGKIRRCNENIYTRVPTSDDQSRSRSQPVGTTTRRRQKPHWASPAVGASILPGRRAEVLSGALNMEAQCWLRKGQYSSHPPTCPYPSSPCVGPTRLHSISTLSRILYIYIHIAKKVLRSHHSLFPSVTQENLSQLWT